MLPPLSPVARTLLEFVANKLRSKLLILPRGEGSCFVSAFRDMPLAARYLLTGLRHQSCAVVGNSPAISARNHGAEIDEHDVVVRFNFAPTRGYERHVGSKTTVRVMGRSWVWNETAEAAAGAAAPPAASLPLTLHRYNNPAYLDEDRRLNGRFPIATLEHYFARSAFLLGMHAGKKAKLLKQNATAAERAELRRYRWGHERLSISSGFAGLLFAMHACSTVSLYGFDLAGATPGHYFDDASEGIVAKLLELALREPWRKDSLSVDPGIEGVSLVSRGRPGTLERERAKHAARAGAYRAWIEQQYANATPSHPYVLERGVIRVLVEQGCVRLGGVT